MSYESYDVPLYTSTIFVSSVLYSTRMIVILRLNFRISMQVQPYPMVEELQAKLEDATVWGHYRRQLMDQIIRNRKLEEMNDFSIAL